MLFKRLTFRISNMKHFFSLALILFVTVSLIPAKQKTVGTTQNSINLLLAIPINASENPSESNTWLKGLLESYFHFRISANHTVKLIPPQKVYQSVMSKVSDPSQIDLIPYSEIAKELGATHILQQNYELNKDGKRVHYYAEISSVKKSKQYNSFERDFTIDHLSSTLDSCILWSFTEAGITFNQENLGRFFKVRIVSKDLYDIGTLGKIVQRRYSATRKDLQTSQKALHQIVKRDPHNLLAQYTAAQFSEELQKNVEAAELFRVLLEILPNHAKLYLHYAKTSRLSGNHSVALTCAANAENKKIITSALMLEGALALEAMGKSSKARKAYSVILAKNKNELSALLFFARDWNQQKQPSKALEYCNKIFMLYPNNASAHLEKGKALSLQKKYAEAIKSLKVSAKLMPQSSEPYRLIGDIHCLCGEYKEAASIYEKALVKDPKDFKLTMMTVDMWDKSKEYQQSYQSLSKAENHFPDNLEIQKRLGLTSAILNDTANALFHLENYINKGGKDSEVFFTLGSLYNAKGLFNKAFYMLNHSLAISGDTTNTKLSLGLLYLKKGDVGAAITNFKSVLKQNPENPEVYRYLGDAWFAEESYTNAMKNYKKARYFKRKDPYIQGRIATIYFKSKEYNAATREYQQLLTLDNTNSNAYYYCAISQLHLKRVQLAEANLEKAYSLGKPNSDIFYHIGVGFLINNQTAKAMEYFNQCQTLDPKHEQCLLTLYSLYYDNKKWVLCAEIGLKLFELNNDKYTDYLAKAGFLFEKSNEVKRARHAFSHFVKRDYNNPDVYIHLARMEGEAQNFESVISILKKIPQSSIKKGTDRILFAKAYYVGKKFSEAIPWFKKALQKDGRNIVVLEKLARSHEKIGDIESAIETYRNCASFSKGKQQSDYLYNVAVLLEQLNKNELAIQQFTENIIKHPKDSRNYSILVKLYRKSQNWGAARSTLEEAIGNIKTDASLYRALAEVCKEQNDRVEAIKNYKKYLTSYPSNDTILYEIGQLYYKRGSFTKALPHYVKAYRINPEELRIIVSLAKTYYQTKDYPNAVLLLEKVVRIDSLNSEIVEHLITAHRKLDNKGELSKYLQQLIALQPQNHHAQLELGKLLYAQGKTTEAIIRLEEVCRIVPNNLEIHVMLSEVYAQTGNQNGRFSHLKQALTHAPDNADVLMLLGKFYMEQRLYPTAFPYIEKALKINPDHTEALYFYSVYLLANSNTEQALLAIKKAMKDNAFNAHYLAQYAKVNIALDKFNLALETVGDALVLDSTNVEILSCAGFLYKKFDRLDEAKEILLKAIALDTTCSDCYSLLGDIYFEDLQCAKAVGFLQRAVSIAGFDEKLMIKLGSALMLSYRYNDAREVFEKVYKKSPHNNEVYYRMIHSYILQEKFAKVEELAAKRNRDKKTVWDHLAEGEMHEAKGNFEAARISYSVSLRLDNQIAEAYAGIGRLNLAEGNFNDAIIDFSKSIAKDPYNPYLQLDLGKAYEGIGQESSAIETYLNIMETFPHIPDSYLLIANIKSRQQKHQKAVVIIQKGLASVPNDASLHSLLGFEFKILGQFNNAIAAYTKAAENGGKNHIDAYLQIANIYQYELKNEKEAKKFIRKYLKKGGKKEQVEKYNLASVQL